MNRITLRISAACILLILFSGCGSSVSYNLNPGGRHVRTGIERFIGGPVKKYRGRKAALVTNHSGYDFDLRQNIQLLRDSGVTVSMVLAPEHGIYGYKNDLDFHPVSFDRIINCHIYNLYGINRNTLRYLIQQVDIVIFDIQDMGMRCYTYITNLKDIMDAMDGLDRELIVLDRPNPVGFLGIDGSFLEKRYATKYVSAFPAPFLYDMTIGESARYYRGQFRPKVKLRVINMGGYSRRGLFNKTGLPWIPPSPNLPTYESAIVYTAIVLMEGINLSLGRGTTKPFEYIGAPWIEPVSFCKKLEELKLKSFRFKPVYFKPTFSKYANMRCGGAQIFYTGGKFSPTETAYRIIGAVMKNYPYLAQWVRFGPFYDIDGLAGTDKFRVYIQAGKPWKEFIKATAPGIKEYRKKRRKYTLY
ncbi:MAG: DUF1343 domain-containing protein [Spirochaetes bacterium]|nr:DUF1343 domain-containing protein [Spirochaetota bacterium]